MLPDGPSCRHACGTCGTFRPAAPEPALNSPPEATVLLTRSRADNARLAASLRREGLSVTCWTTARLRLVAPDGGRPELLRALEDAEVVAFTSRRGALALRGLGGGRLGRLLAGRRVAAVGSSTAELLRRCGVAPEWTGEAGAESLFASLARELPAGARVLLLRGEDAEDAGTLRDAGLVVDDRRVYRQDVPPPPACALRRFGAVACASPSAARRIVGWHPWITGSPFVAIGETTAAALRELGVEDVSVAQQPTAEGLGTAVLTLLARPATPARPAAHARPATRIP